MIDFRTYLNEATVSSFEVNLFTGEKKEKTDMEKKAVKAEFEISFGKNKYAETAILKGEKSKVVKFLKSLGYSEEEITTIK